MSSKRPGDPVGGRRGVGSPARDRTDAAARLQALTSRELEVLALLSMGATGKAIADQLAIKPPTVKQRLKNVYLKLGAATASKRPAATCSPSPSHRQRAAPNERDQPASRQRSMGRVASSRAARTAVALVLAATAALVAASSAAAAARPRFPALAGAAIVMHPAKAIPGPSRTRGATMAGIVLSAEARSRPGAGRKVWRVGTQTSWSSESQVLLVLGSAIHDGRQWLRVLLPIRPDHTTGWIPRNNVVLLHTRYWVTVDKHARTVTVYGDGRQLHRYRAVIGKPATPTPDGLAAIWEKDPQPDPTAFLGPWALPLTVFSNVLFNFGGGPGRVAIHGRDGASLLDPIGTAASHGCIRIDNSPITWIAHHLPQGTPVQITH